jgi:hypothetical protein
MKYVILVVVMILLGSFGACTLTSGAPRHSADEVAAIAESLSPTCQKLLPPDPAADCG